MTRRSIRILAIFAGLAGASGALAQSQYGFHLVTHSVTPAEELEREAVSSLVFGSPVSPLLTWP